MRRAEILDWFETPYDENVESYISIRLHSTFVNVEIDV